MNEPTRESELCEAIFVQLRDVDIALLKTAYEKQIASVKEATPQHISKVYLNSEKLQELDKLILIGMYAEHHTLHINAPHLAGLSKSRMPGVVLCTRYDDKLKIYSFENAYFLDVHTLSRFELGIVGLMLLWISGLRQPRAEEGAIAAKTIEVPADQAKLLRRISYVLANPDVRNEAVDRKLQSLLREVQRYAKRMN